MKMWFYSISFTLEHQFIQLPIHPANTHKSVKSSLCAEDEAPVRKGSRMTCLHFSLLTRRQTKEDGEVWPGMLQPGTVTT